MGPLVILKCATLYMISDGNNFDLFSIFACFLFLSQAQKLAEFRATTEQFVAPSGRQTTYHPINDQVVIKTRSNATRAREGLMCFLIGAALI